MTKRCVGWAALAAMIATGCGKAGLAPVDGATAGQALAGDAEDGSSHFDASGSTSFAPAPCPGGGTVNITVVADSDADGVPGTLGVDYSACKFTGANGYLQVDGQANWSDPTPAVADTSAHLGYSITDLASTNDDKYQITVQVTGSADVSSPAANSYQMTGNGHGDTTYKTPNRTRVVTHTHQWTWVYTPATPGSFHLGQALADGTMTATGTWSFDTASKHVDADVSTITPLTIVPRGICPTHVTAGHLQAAFTDGTKNATIDVTWTGCSQRTVQFTEN